MTQKSGDFFCFICADLPTAAIGAHSLELILSDWSSAVQEREDGPPVPPVYLQFMPVVGDINENKAHKSCYAIRRRDSKTVEQ